MPDNDLTQETDFDDIGEALEQHEDKDSKMAEAYRRWEQEGDKEMLQNLTDTLHRSHAWDVKDKLGKKGRSIDYDKSDAGHLGAILSAASIIGHPLVLTAWITLGYKITRDSKRSIDSTKEFWERLDDFGFELFYYLTYSAAVAYLLIGLQGQEIVLSDAGTVAQIVVEVINFAGL